MNYVSPKTYAKKIVCDNQTYILLFLEITVFFVTLFQNFTGNKDRDSVVTHWFPRFIARYVRVLPLTWSGLTNCMRIELFGCRNGKYASYLTMASHSSPSFDHGVNFAHPKRAGRLKVCVTD